MIEPLLTQYSVIWTDLMNIKKNNFFTLKQ
jgi:hypothetical protein